MDGGILSQHVKILNADDYFFFADYYFLSQFVGLLRSVVKCLKAEGSFVFADGNSLNDVCYFLNGVVNLVYSVK